MQYIATEYSDRSKKHMPHHNCTKLFTIVIQLDVNCIENNGDIYTYIQCAMYNLMRLEKSNMMSI